MDKLAGAGEELSNPSPQPNAATPALFKSMVSNQLQPGQVIDRRFKIISVIAAGGYGCVYKVQHILMKKVFALKMMHPVVAKESTLLRMRREAEAVSKLDHPSIVSAHDFGMTEDGSQPFLVMEFVEGPTLSELLKQRTRLPWKEALQIFIPLCYAMAYAHDQGIIHRDIKPGNIILARDEHHTTTPKIVDFGIAKLQSNGDGLDLTQTGDVFGTPLYMSPEQCAGTGVDSRSDIYALGCVMFETLTGAPPFRGNNALETMMQRCTATAPSLKEASLGLEFPDQLEQLVAKMLAKDCHERYQNCMDVGHDLLLLQKGDVDGMRVIAVPAHASTEVVKSGDWDWRSSILMFLLGAAFSAGIACYVYEHVVHQVIDNSTTRGMNKQNEEVNRWYRPVLFADQGYFRADPNKGVFSFPTYDLGTLKWQKDKAHGSVKVMGVQTVPQGAKLYFETGLPMLSAPYFWAFFRKDDLTGIQIAARTDNPMFAFYDETDFAMMAATQQQDLQALILKGMTLSERGLKSIGEVEGLRYLRLNKIRIADKSERYRNIRGSELAALPNILNIETLVLEDIDDVAPLLTRLKAGHVRKLMIQGAMTKSELARITQIHSLEFLDLPGVMSTPLEEDLSLLSELPNLKRVSLSIEADIAQPGALLKPLPRLEKLLITYSGPGQGEWAKKSQALRDRLRVPSTFNKQTDFIVETVNVKTDNSWFLPWNAANFDL